MKTSYNEILNRMKTAFFESSGEKVSEYSDVAVRLEAAASELFAIACEADYVLKQAFAQTATGQYLDYHAEMRDIERKTASKSRGELVFSVNEPALSDTAVPAGTLCSKAGEPYIQFETLESAVIPAGETSVSVNAAATESGWENNAPEGTVTVMVNPPSGIDSVINPEAFAGGCSAESDDALRKRILSAYRIPQTGYSLETIKTAVLKNPDILDCRPTFENGALNLLLHIKSGCDFSEISQQVTDSLALCTVFGCTINVAQAAPCGFSLTVEIKTDSSDIEQTVNEVRKAIEDYASGVGIGEDITINRLIYFISRIDGVKYCEASSPSAVQGLIICPQNSYLSLSETEVNSYEQYI